MTASYPRPLIVKVLDDDRTMFEVCLEFSYITESGEQYWVPVNFPTDFASVPKPFRSLIDRAGRHSRAAVIHDYLYAYQVRSVPRHRADQIFLEAMTTSNVKPWRRRLIWLAVRAFGWIVWNRRKLT